MNSPQFAGRSLSVLVSRIASPGRPEDEVVEELYLTIVARYPTAAEQATVQELLQQSESSSEDVYQSVAWALLMSSEFSLNH
jgi:hypothetical protein